MSKELVNLANIVPFPKSCGLCESKENVQLFAGLSFVEAVRKTSEPLILECLQLIIKLKKKKAQD
jgi:hypothetical protein